MRDSTWRLLRGLLPYGLLAVLGVPLFLFLTADFDDMPRADGIVFHDPGALLLLFGCVLVCWVAFHLHRQRGATFAFSRVSDLGRMPRGPIGWLASLPRVLRVLALAVLVVALARPQAYQREEIEVEGIDIMLVLDLSKSMEEPDMRPRRDRLDAAQYTVRKFLTGRKNDRMGLAVFAKEAMLQAPLTLDYQALDAIVADLDIGDLDPMGTAIGDALGLAIASLRRSDARSRVIILLTDGDWNVRNEMDPDEAIELAKERDIRIFTVLMGRETPAAPMDFFGRRPYSVNPELLQRIAAETGGRFFRAGDVEALDRGFDEVRQTLEKSKRREVGVAYRELYPRFAMAGLALLLLEVLLSLTRFRRFP